MKFEETIQYFYDHYALVYRHRWQVLDQLFCVLGNGFEWKNGELVEERTEKDHKQYKAELGPDGKARLKEEVEQKLYQDNYDRVVKSIEQDREALVRNGWTVEKAAEECPLDEEKLWKRVVALTDRMANREIKFYPLSTGSELFCIPDDIKPDWLEGAKETIELLLKHEDFNETEDKNEWQIEQMLKAKERLDKLLEKYDIQ